MSLRSRFPGAFFYRAWFLLTFALFVALLHPVRAQNGFQGKVVRVNSGDEIRVQLDSWIMTVRLHGIDAPKQPKPLRDVVQAFTERRTLATNVRVTVLGTGPKETVYGEVTTADSKSLNSELIEAGLATWARSYAPDRTHLGKLESEARRAHRGLWGATDGRNVVLPPALQTIISARSSPTSSASPQVTTTPPPLEITLPVKHPVPPPGLSRALLAVFGVSTLSLLFVLQWATGWNRHCLLAQILLSLLVAVGLVAFLPFVFLLSSNSFDPTPAALVAGTAVPLVAICGWYSIALTRGEQLLRTTPAQPISQLTPGLVKLRGETSVPEESVCHSLVGKIPGLYLREVTTRYETHSSGYYDAKSGRGRKRSDYRWTEIYNETTRVDFTMSDEASGEIVVVETSRAQFHPLRVARFYNDIPVETWFNKPYAGDTRTEIYFIPPRADVTVWGRYYQTASPVPGTSEGRISYDALRECLVIVEGDEGRIWSRRALIGLLLMLAALGLVLLISYCLVTPEAFRL